MSAAETWWRTIGRGGTCGSCGEPILAGQTMAFRYEDRAARCMICADSEGLEMRDSKRMKAPASPVEEAILKQLAEAGHAGLRFRHFVGIPGPALMSTLTRLKVEGRVAYREKVRHKSPSCWVAIEHARAPEPADMRLL